MSASLLAHLLGDYVIQTDHMAAEKTSAHRPALAHALTYTVPFLAVTRRWQPLAVIAGTHFVIDRWRLARHVVWAKNQAAPWRYRYPWSHATLTGYHSERLHEADPFTTCVAPSKPDWLAVPLMIVADNTLHGLLNGWALRRWGRRR